MVELLRSDGNDVLWAGIDCKGRKNAALLDFAEAENRVLLTLDKNFWWLSQRYSTPLVHSGVVLFRRDPAARRNIEPLVRQFMSAGKTWNGFVSIVTADGIQMTVSRGGPL